MTPRARLALVQSFGLMAWSEMRRGYVVCVHAEDCAAMTDDADGCTCHPYKIRPEDPRPMADILASIQRAQRWH